MNFNQAFEAMKQGEKVKLPSWGGYWCWDAEKETIMMHCRTKDADAGQGPVLDIRETQRVEYTLRNILSDEWVVADETNTPVLGGMATFTFGEAIKYLKRGMKVARKGWNGKINTLNWPAISLMRRQMERLSIVIMKPSETRLLHLWEHQACRWGGLLLRLICSQRIGCFQSRGRATALFYCAKTQEGTICRSIKIIYQTKTAIRKITRNIS